MYRLWGLPALMFLACSVRGETLTDNAYNGDDVISACDGAYLFDRNDEYRVRMVDGSGYAAMAWQKLKINKVTGEVQSKSFERGVVPPSGALIESSMFARYRAVVDACWVLMPVAASSELPLEVPDATERFTVQCSKPKQLEKQPELIAMKLDFSMGITVDPKHAQMIFFGTPLVLIPRRGRAQLGIKRDIAVLLDELTSEYRVVLPDGRPLFGQCLPPSNTLAGSR